MSVVYSGPAMCQALQVFHRIILFSPPSNIGGEYYYLHFPDEEIEAPRVEVMVYLFPVFLPVIIVHPGK